MGMYRAFYLLNWVWRYMTQEGYSDWIVWVAGIIQTVLYLDFFYYYILVIAILLLALILFAICFGSILFMAGSFTAL